MAPKKPKTDDKKSKDKKKHKAGESSGQLRTEGLWKERLIEAEVNDDNWRCSVAMLVEETLESCEIIEHYRSAAKDGSRPVVKNIDRSDIIAMIPTKRRSTKTPSPKKKKKDKKKGPEGNKKETLALDDDIDQLIDASASVMHDSVDGSLPTDLLSLLVKCLILRLKNEDVLRREIILQEEQARLNIDLGIPEGKNKKGKHDKGGKKGKDKKAQEKDDDKRKSKSEKNTRSSEDSSPKKEKNQEGRKSKSKGKKEKERELIEDQPLDGPHLYITLTGFYDAHLPIELTKIRVPINSIVKISGERILADESDITETETETDYTTPSGDYETSSDVSTKYPDKSIKSTKALANLRKSSTLPASSKKKKGKSLVSNRPDEAEVRNFWVIMKNNLNAADTPLLINNIAFLTLPPQERGDLVEKEVYDQVCNVLFDTHDLTWLHERYLSAMAIREIPNERLKVGTEVLDELMRCLPPGRLNVGFFLNAMLAQVCHTETLLMSGMHSKDKSRNKNKRRKSKEMKKKALFIRGLYSIVFEERNSFFHTFSPDNNLPEATVNMLKYDRAPTLLKLFKPVDEIANEIHMYRLWEHSDPDLVTFDTLRTFLQMLRINTIECKKLPTYEMNTGCSRFQSVVVDDLFDMTTYHRKLPYRFCQTANKRDHSLTYQEALIVRYLNTDIVAFKNLLHSLIKEKKLTKNMYFYEDKSPDVNLQCLNEAYNKFNCMDYVYIDVLDTVVLQFHNRHDKRGIFDDYWSETLTTPVGLRDFCSFIITENTGWVQHEQERLKEQRKKKLEELEKIRNEQFQTSEVPLDNATFQENTNMPRKDCYSEEVYRRDGSVSSSMRTSCLEIHEDYGKLEYLGVEEKLFEGYNLGSLRIQINGRTSTFYSTNSSQVRVETRKWLYGGDKLLGIEIVKSGHTLILNKTTDSTETQSSVSFHVISASNIVLTLKERNTEILPLPSPEQSQSTDQITEISSETTEEHKPVQETAKKSKRGRKEVVKVEEEPEVPEIKVPDTECEHTHPKSISYDVKLSWPTGLLMETVPCSTGEYPMYVRQRYASCAVPKAVRREKYRCILSNGNVLVFKKNGKIIIMTPNGTIFKCKRYRHQEPIRTPSPPPPPPPPPPTPEESDQLGTSGDKNILKKGNRDSKKGKTSIDKEEETAERKGKKGKKSTDKEEETPGKKDKKGKKSVKKKDEAQEKEDNKEEKKEEEIQREKELEVPSTDDEEEPAPERRRSVRWSLMTDTQGTEPDLPLLEPPDLPHLPASSETKVELPEFSPLNVIEYDVLTPMGENYTVKDGMISKIRKYMPLRIDTNEKSGEVYIVRTDGTETYFREDGNLLVTFPDGTRISTRMILDEEENAQQNIETEGRSEEGEYDDEGANEEVEDYGNEENEGEDGEIGANGDGGNDEGEYVETETNEEEYGEKEANEIYVQDEDDELENGLMDAEGSSQERLTDYSPIDSESEESIIKSFESVHLGSLVEHPNYANISFDCQSNITKIVMPTNVEMCIWHSEGEISIKLDKNTRLEQRQKTLKFSLGPFNKTYINLDDSSLENHSPLCETTDERGDRFIIFSSGETSYIPNEDEDQRSKVTSSRNIKRYFALSRDLSGREFFPRCVHGEYLHTILEGGGRVEIQPPKTDPLIYLYKICKPIWDTPTQKWTAKYVPQQEHPKHLNPSNLSNLHYNPYVWLQYRNRTCQVRHCRNVRPRKRSKQRQDADEPWRVIGRMFYDITKEFAETILEGLEKYCDEGVASVDLFMSYETWLEPWQQEIVDEALKTGQVPVMKVFAHYNNHVDRTVMKSLNDIVQKYIVLERRARQK